MKLIENLSELKKMTPVPSAAALGTFDGVHLGHQEVIAATGRYAKAYGLKLMVFTFSTHPMASLMPELEPQRLLDNRSKIQIMQSLGVDILVNLPFTPELAQISAEDFLQLLTAAGVKAVGIGDNFSFGAGGKGNAQYLRAQHEKYGLTVLARPLLTLDGQIVSSTNIRRAINRGDLDLANKMLGRPYEIRGKVIHGEGRGRLLGYPTANVQLLGRNIAMPKSGVYAGQVVVEKNLYGSMINVGDNPTFTDADFRLEAYLFAFSGDLYGQEIRVRLLHRIREELKFDSLEALLKQIQEDEKTVRNFL
ncbi:bifunctional riboflavin kinase/FAD synthetase [Acidaminococcus sp. NSJ-142]|jgi:riboflavin kinase/FMN adenylyltransferase|uniref:bifunctional riboflavin kinase/FAD synthetase n=1 Tax=Acidaminococcus TaxID=904 RepID=UPI000CF91DE6|nr:MULTISPECIES: bifunctional riboflavin kinase/FAD synthetase [Acidaminococcus]MCD2435490.1 bifunctional riboflavin kinase/FAD synthetase [Acidaminococcus hominis]MCH4095238.1 bifunctional riboflavin kinase/FAD synthetase [Acidaminococcus provencensis]RHK03457.1 bifunctional riboflavin kinase/FAD synthetase [Acidaminococcus sp. AM05-11]